MFKFKINKTEEGGYEVILDGKRIACFENSDDKGDDISAIQADAFTIGYTTGYCDSKGIKFP